jgi:hypothetical protein
MGLIAVLEFGIPAVMAASLCCVGGVVVWAVVSFRLKLAAGCVLLKLLIIRVEFGGFILILNPL